MSVDRRLLAAALAMRDAGLLMQQAEEAPDPVDRRRKQVQAAVRLRAAADLLDDHGRLTE